MVRLKVIIVGTSPAETLRVEEALQQAGYLETFRYVGLEQALDRVPDWDEWDLLIVRYQDRTGSTLLSLLAPVLRKLSPPVIFLVDPFDPILVTRLLNANARRVLPIDILEQVIEAGLAGVFNSDLAPAARRVEIPAGENVVHSKPSATSEKLLMPDALFPPLFRSSPIGLSINRLHDGRCLDCNESFARLLEWPREELIGHVSLELGTPEDIHKCLEQDGRSTAAPDGQPGEQLSVQFERKIYTRSRRIRHIQVSLDRIDWAGEECVLFIVQDITETEQAKEKIKRLNDELERLVLIRTGALEAANRELAAEIGRRKVLEDFSNQLSQIIWETPDVVAICAPDGRMQFLNKAGRTLFGLSEDEPVSHLDLFSAYSEEMCKWIREEVQPVVIQRGIWRGETAFQLGEGRVIPLSQVLLCKKDDSGAVQFFASIARDVSDFKHVEQELRQSRERYRTLAEAAHDFIFMVSRDGLMEYANEYACQALGFDPSRVEGIPASQFFPKDFAENHLHMFSEVHEIDRPIYTEGPFLRDGQESWLGTWLVPIHTENGSLISILGISRDITEQKKTDEALQRALQNERKLGEMRSNFFSMTSHQFRTPLSTILLSAELLLKYGPRWDDQKRSEHLGRIQDASKRLNSMLEDILVIGRVESGRYVCTPKDFDLIAFCGQSIHEISTNDRNEHELIFQHTQDNVSVYLDPEVMHRVIDNLLSNAIKYSPKGTQVTVNVKMEDHHVLLEVADQGIGIPERDLKFLFQPFQRGSNAGDFPGTGIGLTIIQKSVELMNGSVSLKSKEGQGTTFMVRFPARFESNSDRVAA
jgi:PAS domain S-box-containing protein